MICRSSWKTRTGWNKCVRWSDKKQITVRIRGGRREARERKVKGGLKDIEKEIGGDVRIPMTPTI